MMSVDTLITLALGIIMFSIGTSLLIDDFKNVFQYPKALTIGLILQMLFLPILAFSVCYFLPISNDIKMGIVILSLCPGGATSNFINYLLDLKTALSVSLTMINSFLILFTIPLGFLFFNQFFGTKEASLTLPFYSSFQSIALIILLPVIVGLAFRQMFPDLTIRLANPMKYLSTLLLAIVFAIKIFAGETQGGAGLSAGEIVRILPIILFIHICSMILSFLLSKSINIEQFRALTISIEVGLQNTTLALLLTSVYLANNEMSKPSIVYAMFSFFTTILFGYFVKNRILKTK